MAEDPRDGDGFEEEERFSPESKVGLFVLGGLVILMISILMLGDIHFRPQNTIFAIFRNIEGITDKSPIKVSGVDVGSVKKVELVDNRARIAMALQKNLRLYRNARVRIRSTGIIGSKFLALEPGAPEAGIPESEQRLKSGDTILGEDVLSLDEMMERVAKSLDQFTGNGALGSNLNATMANLRNITDSLNAAIGQQRQAMVDIVRNVDSFTASAKSAAAHLDDILSSSKEEIKSAIHNLKETMEKTNSMLASIQRGEGTIGTLVYDKNTADNVKQTVENLKQTSESAKQVLARYTKVRAFWELQGRRDLKAGVDRGDVGLRLEPRPNKYYEIMVQNIGDKNKMTEHAGDYERSNTITALIGGRMGAVSGAVGAIRSEAGVEARYRPFQDTLIPVANRMELFGQAYDFGRDVIRKGRPFKTPNYIAGARYQANQWLSGGLQWEDIAQTTDLHALFNVSFEDRDLAYLLGFVSFSR